MWTISGTSVTMPPFTFTYIHILQFIKEADSIYQQNVFHFASLSFMYWENFAVSILVGSVAPLNLPSLKIQRGLHWISKETYAHPLQTEHAQGPSILSVTA